MIDRVRCFLMNRGFEINECHDLHTNRNSTKILAGSLASISVIISTGRSAIAIDPCVGFLLRISPGQSNAIILLFVAVVMHGRLVVISFLIRKQYISGT